MKQIGRVTFQNREGAVLLPLKQTKNGKYRKLNPNRPRAGREIVLTKTCKKWNTKLFCQSHGIQVVTESDGFNVKLECGCERAAAL